MTYIYDPCCQSIHVSASHLALLVGMDKTLAQEFPTPTRIPDSVSLLRASIYKQRPWFLSKAASFPLQKRWNGSLPDVSLKAKCRSARLVCSRIITPLDIPAR